MLPNFPNRLRTLNHVVYEECLILHELDEQSGSDFAKIELKHLSEWMPFCCSNGSRESEYPAAACAKAQRAMVTFRRKLTGGRRAWRTEGSRTEQTEALLCICSLTSHASLVATHRSTASSSSTPQSNQGWFWFPAAPIELQENHVRHTYPLHTDSLLLLYSPFGRKRPTIWLCTARRSIWSAELCKSDPAANKNSVVIIDYHGKCIPITLGLCLVRGEKVFMKIFYLFDH